MMPSYTDRLTKLCNEYMDIFSKHTTDNGKTYQVQMMHIPKDYQTPRPGTVHAPPLNTMPGLGKN